MDPKLANRHITSFALAVAVVCLGVIAMTSYYVVQTRNRPLSTTTQEYPIQSIKLVEVDGNETWILVTGQSQGRYAKYYFRPNEAEYWTFYQILTSHKLVETTTVKGWSEYSKHSVR